MKKLLPVALVALVGGCDVMIDLAVELVFYPKRASDFRITTPDDDGIDHTLSQYARVAGHQRWSLDSVRWENRTTGDSGQADLWVDIDTDLEGEETDREYCWEFTVLLAPGENDILAIGTDWTGETYYDAILIIQHPPVYERHP